MRRWGPLSGSVQKLRTFIQKGQVSSSRSPDGQGLAAAPANVPTTWVPPGHYYSPIADLDDLARRADEIFDMAPPLPDVDLNLDEQRRHFGVFAAHYDRLALADTKQPRRRYFCTNDWFGPGDAYVFAAMLLEHKPRRVIEVGSGYSSALLLDINEKYFSGAIHCTFIEPYPERLLSLAEPGDLDRARLIRARIQEVTPETFDVLEAGDMLFVDSTHISKAGSDVNHIFFRLLPRLKPGVLIHFHDIFYPFEYPREWFFNGNRSWNELYLLRAFLMNNGQYRVVFFNSCFAHLNPDARALMPDFWKNPGGSFWMVKTDS